MQSIETIRVVPLQDTYSNVTAKLYPHNDLDKIIKHNLQ